MHLSFELVVNCVRNWVLNTLGTLREGGCCLLLLLSRLQVARKEARKETAPQELQTGERGGSFCLYRVMFVSCVWLKLARLMPCTGLLSAVLINESLTKK